MRKPVLASLACVALLSLSGCAQSDKEAAPKLDPDRFQYTLTKGTEEGIEVLKADQRGENVLNNKDGFCSDIDNNTYFVAKPFVENRDGEEENTGILLAMGDGKCLTDVATSYDKAVVVGEPVTLEFISAAMTEEQLPVTAWSEGAELMGDLTPWDGVGPLIRAAINRQGELAVEGIKDPEAAQ